MEDAPLLAQTPACLDSLLLPAKLFFAGSQKPPQQLKSRPNRIGIWSFIINDLHRPTTQTLGHYCYVLTNDALARFSDESVTPVGLGRAVHNVATFQNL